MNVLEQERAAGFGTPMHAVRSENLPILFDPEIEKTARSLRRQAKERKWAESISETEPKSPAAGHLDFTAETEEESLEQEEILTEIDQEEVMAENRTVRELQAAPVEQQPMCITYPELEAPFELKSGLIQTGNTREGLPLPSQTVVNPRENASAITLRSGKELNTAAPKKGSRSSKEEAEKEFLKELCTNKRKVDSVEKVEMGEVCSAMIQRKRLPPKCKDRGMFAIPYKIGNVGIKRSMCDLGASINVIPLSVYSSFKGCPLKETRIIIQLADRSIVYPVGLLEDVLVQAHYLWSSLSMEFDGEKVEFNVYEAMKYPSDVSSICSIDVIDPLAQEMFELNAVDELDLVLCRNINMDSIKEIEETFLVNENVQEIQEIGVRRLETNQPLTSSRSHIVFAFSP
ncbi:uncharacterized protein LOC119371259 [Jatropha curcas]|uniref:uncharacterized protein LOC119371259 n=1 Tax=Jatropha curcas TaxID=180498 RepID=UPI001896229F|nr:uncharacterized protein LOC119371259 [Jatropha curcas]